MAPPPANPEFSDAARYAFREFESEDPAALAFAVRQLERELYLGLDLEAESSGDRALTPESLVEEDVSSLSHPDRDPSLAVAITVATLSPNELSRHTALPLLIDLKEVEPTSPTKYDRSFLNDSQACWADRSCAWLRTRNDLIKETALFSIAYEMPKDYRWIDLNLPEPADVPAGEIATNDGTPRWAFVARSWTESRAVEEGGAAAIEQSYSFEIWVPRQGTGLVRDGSESNANDGTWTVDSQGEGTLRMMCLWAETTLSFEVEDDWVASLTRTGIQDIFDAQDAWLEAN